MVAFQPSGELINMSDCPRQLQTIPVNTMSSFGLYVVYQMRIVSKSHSKDHHVACMTLYQGERPFVRILPPLPPLELVNTAWGETHANCFCISQCKNYHIVCMMLYQQKVQPQLSVVYCNVVLNYSISSTPQWGTKHKNKICNWLDQCGTQTSNSAIKTSLAVCTRWSLWTRLYLWCHR